MSALIRDIGESATEHGRLRLAAENHIYAAHAKEAELVLSYKEMADAESEHCGIEKDCEKVLVPIARLDTLTWMPRRSDRVPAAS
ncbi:hypothetical protein [Cupriavidus sp. DF5525]|uniref:hypothetical protein n=1 Tax=Cupriavidus sp. DF5525 TaxID=3160989 RepID=UPI0032DFD256